MEEKLTKTVNGKPYTILIFSIHEEVYWRVGDYEFNSDRIARDLQEQCGYAISDYGFSDFGAIGGVAYWESRVKLTVEK